MTYPCDRVLVVDDDTDILDALAQALREEGIQVHTAEGADAALLDLQQGFLPDVVLTDLMMPGRSGEDLIDDLRRNPATHDLAIVAMSANAASLMRVRGKANGELAKPFSLHTMDVMLASVC